MISRRMTSKDWASIFLIITIGFAGGCQRSPQFKREEAMGRGDFGPSQGVAKTSGALSGGRFDSVGQPKKRVMVLNFWNDSPAKEVDLGGYVAGELQRGLYLSQKVVIPTDIKTELTTADFVQGDQVKVAQLIREGRKLGVAVIIIGRISKVVFREQGDDVGLLRQKTSIAAVELETKLFDVQGGRELLAISRFGETSQKTVSTGFSNSQESADSRVAITRLAAMEAVAHLIPDVMASIDKMMWQGRIAKIVASKAYLNAGKASGLAAGDILRVTTPGDDIFDPVTGAYLGRAKGQLKGTVEVVDFIGSDGSTAAIHTGGNFREGDLVQLY
jgi:hypothetical protein